MAQSAFLRVNGYNFPTPKRGNFSYILSKNVNAGRNANGAVIGQLVGRELVKLDGLEWACLEPDVWHKMLDAVEDYFIPVTIEDYRTGGELTVYMYPGDISATPLFVNSSTHKVTKYENCAFNLVDCGW